MRYVFGVLLALVLWTTGGLLAQDEPPPADPSGLMEALATAQAYSDSLNAQLAELEAKVGRAETTADLAFNLLGLFEAIGVLVTIGAAAAAVIGIPRFIAATNELQAARKRFDEEIDASHERLEKDAAEKQAQINALRDELKQSTSSATLALSFLPLGESQYRSGDYLGALDIYQRALELDANNPIIQYRLGYVYTQMGRLAEAETHLRRALDVEPDFAPALAVLGYTCRRMAEPMEVGLPRDMLQNQAEQYLQRALALSPRLVDDDGESWWGSLGGLYRRRGQIDQAIRAYTEAGKVTPNSSYAFSNLALLYMQQGNREQMIDTYHKVEQLAIGEINANPDNYWATADLLTARLALSKFDEADAALQAVMTTAPVDSSYALESQMDTMGRLAEVLEPAKAQVVQSYIDRLRAFADETRRQRQQTLAQETQTRMQVVQITDQMPGD